MIHDRIRKLTRDLAEGIANWVSFAFWPHSICGTYELSDQPWLELKCTCGKGARVVLTQRCGCPTGPWSWCGHIPYIEVLSATCRVYRRYARREGQELAAPTPARTV